MQSAGVMSRLKLSTIAESFGKYMITPGGLILYCYSPRKRFVRRGIPLATAAWQVQSIIFHARLRPSDGSKHLILTLSLHSDQGWWFLHLWLLPVAPLLFSKDKHVFST
ncbi:hypothetical protein TNCV_2754811 [Trichonephila clavipes]|nr:hypothetical protein TNCV_2754811 [Trichonephila clavipes]